MCPEVPPTIRASLQGMQEDALIDESPVNIVISLFRQFKLPEGNKPYSIYLIEKEHIFGADLLLVDAGGHGLSDLFLTPENQP